MRPARKRWKRLNNGKWRVRLHVCRVFASKAQAMRYDLLAKSAVAEVDRRHGEDERPCCSIRSGLEAFISDLRAGMGDKRRSEKTLERHRRRLLAFDKAFRSKPLDAITRKQVKDWMKKRLKGVSADTVNIDLVSLKAFARWAQGEELAPRLLPLLSTPRLDVPEKLAGKNRLPPKALPIDEIRRLIARIKTKRADMGLFLAGMFLFGMRPIQAARLRRMDARPPRAGEAGSLLIRGVKGGADRVALIPPGSVRAGWLRECLALGRRNGRTTPTAPLVPCQSSRSGGSAGRWTTEAFDMALRRMVKGMRVAFTAYQIRHSCMTCLLRTEGIALANSQNYAGHNRADTQNAYSWLLGGEAEPAYREMEKRLKGGSDG